MKDDLSLKDVILLAFILIIVPIVLTAYIAMEWDICSHVWKGMIK